MTDSIGTVRRSPDGVLAMRCEDDPLRAAWAVTKDVSIDSFAGRYRYIGDRHVGDWEVVYTPPPPPIPVGTIWRRKDAGEWGWQIAVMREDGWFVVAADKHWKGQLLNEQCWEVVHGV